MLLAKMKIVFYNVDVMAGNITGYNCQMVTSSTFKFGNNSYYIGFFQPLEDIKEYKFQEAYLVNIRFPSINYDTYCKFSKRWKVDAKLDICIGKKIIGIGELLEHTFSAIV